MNGDAIRVEQVLINYLNNAIDHLDDRKILKIFLRSAGNKIHVSVFNSGEHIPTESMEQIWKSFYKVDKARTRAHGGSGLGLSIVKAIQDLHGNNYGVANQDNGVLFWFELDSAAFNVMGNSDPV